LTLDTIAFGTVSHPSIFAHEASPSPFPSILYILDDAYPDEPSQVFGFWRWSAFSFLLDCVRYRLLNILILGRDQNSNLRLPVISHGFVGNLVSYGTWTLLAKIRLLMIEGTSVYTIAGSRWGLI
jgi:hypothetical protein